MISSVSLPSPVAAAPAIPSPLKWWKHSALQALHVFDGRARPSRDLELDSLPDTVARPLAAMRDPRRPVGQRLGDAREAAVQMLRTGGTLLLADYLDCGTVCSRIERTLPEMGSPQWPEWFRLCQWLCYFFNGDLPERPGRTTRFPRLVSGLRELTRISQGPLMELLRGQQSPPPPRARRHMTEARQLHGVMSLVNQMARSLFLPRRFSIMKLITETPPQVYLLHGHKEFSRGPAHEDWLPALRDAGSVVLVGEMVLPLYSMTTIRKLGMEGARLAMAWTRLERPAEEEPADQQVVLPRAHIGRPVQDAQGEAANVSEDMGLWDVSWIQNLRASESKAPKKKRSQAA